MNAVGIRCANEGSTEDASPLPDMGGTVMGYFRPLTLVRVQTGVKDFEVSEARQEQGCMGCIQPFGPRELKLKSEGQRRWNWQMLHTTPDVKLADDEEFTIKGTRYRVMSQIGYDQYGYIMYELVQDYDGS